MSTVGMRPGRDHGRSRQERSALVVSNAAERRPRPRSLTRGPPFTVPLGPPPSGRRAADDGSTTGTVECRILRL